MPSSSTSRPSELRWLARALSVLLLAAPATAQYDEDTLEPEEIGLRDIEMILVPRTGYVGNETCASCHASTYDRWLSTAHSRTGVAMRSMMAMMMAQKEGVTACCPGKSGMCMACHGTAHDVPAAYRGPGVRMGEGVTCEKCHGPGQEHSELAMAQKERGAWNVEALIASLDEPRLCMSCHREKKSHEALQAPPFDEAAAKKRIAHPSPPSEMVH